MKRKERRRWCAALVLVFLLVNAGFCVIQYREYQQKLMLVYQAAAAEEAGQDAFSWAVQILRDGLVEQQNDRMPQQLYDYGYGENYRDALRRVFMQNCLLSLAGSGALLLFGVLFVCRQERLHRLSRKRDQEELAAKLLLLRKGHYEEAGKQSGLDELGVASLAEQMKLVTGQAAREKEEMKTLVTDISHQLKTPLSALRASLDILQDEGLTPEERREFVERCSLQLVRLEELASALLSISRMETGLIQVKRVGAPVFDTILLAVNRIYPRAQEKRIEIELEENEEAGKTVLLQDVRWLSEAFINILENAVKYSEPGSRITITTERLQTFLRIEFADQGIGIPRQERNRVFLRFYRGEDERVQKENGSGVGLYLARFIIEQHYGTIRVQEAREGSGSIFVVQIPYA